MMLTYPITIFWNAEDNAFVAIAPDLPGCSAIGDTEIEAIKEIQIAIELWIETMQMVGNPIPKPSQPEFLLQKAA